MRYARVSASQIQFCPGIGHQWRKRRLRNPRCGGRKPKGRPGISGKGTLEFLGPRCICTMRSKSQDRLPSSPIIIIENILARLDTQSCLRLLHSLQRKMQIAKKALEYQRLLYALFVIHVTGGFFSSVFWGPWGSHLGFVRGSCQM